MNDTATKILSLADDYADARFEHGFSRSQNLCGANTARQALQDELARLFTPLTDAQIHNADPLPSAIFIDRQPGCHSHANHYVDANNMVRLTVKRWIMSLPTGCQFAPGVCHSINDPSLAAHSAY